jgi:hypothetical protein
MEDFINSSDVSKVPDKIEFTYIHSCDIQQIDSIVKKKYCIDGYYSNQVKKKIFALKLEKERTSLKIKKEKIIVDIKKLEDELRDINNGKILKKYISETHVFLDEFSNGNLKVIDDYIMVASRYFNLDIKKNNGIKITTCINCGDALNFKNLVSDGFITCKNCGVIKPITVFEKQNDDNIIIQKNDSIDFMKEFDKYICKSGTEKLKQFHIDALIKYFGGKEKNEEVRNRRLNKFGKREDTNVKMILLACNALGFHEIIDIPMYIGTVLWNWKLPNYEKFREKIASHYNENQAKINNIPKDVKKRSSNLTVGYRMAREIQLVADVDISDFKIPENEDSFKNQDNIWKLITIDSTNPEIFYMEFCDERK